MTDSFFRSIPEPMIALLLREGRIDQPTGIIESIEASTGIPEFADAKEFEAFLADMQSIADDAQASLRTEFPHLFSRNGSNGQRPHATDRTERGLPEG